MSRATLVTAVCAVAATVLLSGCENPRRTLGLEKQTPDEFMVVARAPLALPPDFSLRPPEPGADRPQETSPRDMARGALTGGVQMGSAPAGGFSLSTGGGFSLGGAGAAAPVASLSRGETALLSQAGTDRIDPDIRQLVNRESSELAQQDLSFTERLMFWDTPTPAGTVVNATEEAQRIRQNQALGSDVSQGETPKIERREKAFLEGLF